MFAAALAMLALLSGALMAWQWIAAVRFPLEQRQPLPAITPSVTVFKPVRGADAGTRDALATWLSQTYAGRVEVLFGVADAQDPVVPVIRELLVAHPSAEARLVFCHESTGINRKVNKLVQMAYHASGDVAIISDADVSAPPDLVAQLIAPFTDAAVGLVHCLYRFAAAPTLATRWEAFVVNGDFWSQVLQDHSRRPLHYALGAVMAVRRADLESVGGFAALANYLADDNRLGRLIVGLGRRTHLCPVVVDCHAAPAGWQEVWLHQLRWAVTIRVCQPGPYFFSILANGTLWPLLWAALAPSPLSLGAGLVLALLRIAQGLALEARFTRRPIWFTHAWIVPLKDLLQVGLWAAAFLRRHVVWRGVRFRVRANGRLEPA